MASSTSNAVRLRDDLYDALGKLTLAGQHMGLKLSRTRIAEEAIARWLESFAGDPEALEAAVEALGRIEYIENPTPEDLKQLRSRESSRAPEGNWRPLFEQVASGPHLSGSYGKATLVSSPRDTDIPQAIQDHTNFQQQLKSDTLSPAKLKRAGALASELNQLLNGETGEAEGGTDPEIHDPGAAAAARGLTEAGGGDNKGPGRSKPIEIRDPKHSGGRKRK